MIADRQVPGDDAIDAVFVYGTLKPGDVRWPLIEPYVTDRRRDSVPGRLYDTGEGYPAAVFDRPGAIRGWTLSLAPDRLGEALAELDVIEGTVWGAYRRVGIVTASGRRTWAYEFGHDTAGLDDLDGHWPERRSDPQG